MAERTVLFEDISDIRRTINILLPVVTDITTKVEVVDNKVLKLHNDLRQFHQYFEDFVQTDLKQKQKQFAQTELLKINQELEKKFGYYNQLRRRTTGILQATDLSLVKRETIASVTDEMMLLAPKYWLGPVLVAMSSWLLDNQELANRAIIEALQRDDEKSSLFFALLMRRAKRWQSCQTWLERYFSMQDPKVLEREIIIILNALVNGVFGAESYTQCLTKIQAWLVELTQEVGYVELQRERWEKALRSKISPLPNDKYPYLSQYSTTWAKLSEVLQEARGHKDIFNYFDQVFEGEIIPQPKFEDEVDLLLKMLSERFDDEELPLTKEQHLQNLIIQHQGDLNKAKQQYDEEKGAFANKISFTQILSDAAISPELTTTSRATQRFAIALSHEWIVSAHQDLTAKNRLKVPSSIDLTINDWQGSSADGSNESELIRDVESYFAKKKEEDLSKVKIKPLIWAYLVVGGLFFLPSLFSKNLFGILIGAGGGVPFLLAKKKNESDKQNIASYYDSSNQKTQQLLRGTLAEIVDWRREYKTSDQEAVKVTEFLETITPEQYILNPHGSSRRLINK